MRRHSRSLLIYLIFGILIAVFIISFGPQSGTTGGCAPSSGPAAEVRGDEISETSWRYGILALGGGSASSERARRAQIREKVLDRLILRELLANAARAAGYSVSEDEVRERILAGDVYILGERLDGKRVYFLPDEGSDVPIFRARALDAFAKNLGLGSVERFLAEQEVELLAAKMRELIGSSVRVSPEEAQTRYQQQNTRAEIQYVTFSPARYRDRIDFTTADLDAYAKAHDAELRKTYEQRKARFTGRGKEVALRVLHVKREAAGGDGAAKPTAKGTGADPARAKIAAALRDVKAGKDFAAVAREVSQDPTAARGGATGWRPVNALRLGEEVAQAVAKLDKGQVSDVIDTPAGYYVVRVEDRREGDVPFEQARRDLAEEALRDERAKALARADAEKALAAAKAGTPLDQQFPPPPEPADDAAPPPPSGAPQARTASDILRASSFIPGLGQATDVVKAIFDELTPGQVAPRVFEAGADLVVFRVTKRQDPDMEKFKTEKAALTASMTRDKAQEVVTAWETSRCQEARQAGEIRFDPARVEYPEAQGAQDGQPVRSTYTPCQTLDPLAALLGGIQPE